LSVAEVANHGVGSKFGATSAAQPGGLVIQQAKNPGAGGYPSTSAIIDQAPSDSIQPDMEQLNESTSDAHVSIFTPLINSTKKMTKCNT
jgi:hypothetical protein